MGGYTEWGFSGDLFTHNLWCTCNFPLADNKLTLFMGFLKL